MNANGRHRAAETIEKLTNYINLESHRFQNTLERGQRRLERILTENQGKTLSGSQIVSLEKKWGVPHLLTAAILHKKGLEFENAEYDENLTHWKQSLEN
jgi:alanyl-tRNA synthetase